ncbi:MAG TPA: nicotinate (nicotinamide) nucleotide adenylyltransferase [Verrucomicrobiales bacterium]|nr:nicotinate (nicotinamide) nucleotide adenylyltransferase [Verrucomicrobiales bacterium]
MPEERIGLFGGTFDPVHLGHLQIAEAAWRCGSLHRIFFVPCRQSPWKALDAAAEPQHRLAMLEMALTDLPWAEVSRMELDRPPPSFSWQTAESFAERFPPPRCELCWILGADQWKTIDRWARASRLASLVTFLVVPRAGYDYFPREGYRAQSVPCRIDLTSTEVRESLRDGRSVDHLLPGAVADYIRKQGLYSSG